MASTGSSAMKPRSRKSLLLEWAGWKRVPSQRQLDLAGPKPVARESVHKNVPQEWVEDKATAMMKRSEGPNPIELLLKVITDIFGLFQGFLFEHTGIKLG
ncbi:expressed unknown protein [Seminavis robusta]|uniref:Uncharacterized protein n=1 Tax=Seminavis robusta TaxID=568900 RepID=A0A9N8E4G7_9STRA|nr:expressed unknown protein [Seminavis robusta]|eukprot:Sro513_g157740.1 n/a (100) ;mRNA; r:8744-9043